MQVPGEARGGSRRTARSARAARALPGTGTVQDEERVLDARRRQPLRHTAVVVLDDIAFWVFLLEVVRLLVHTRCGGAGGQAAAGLGVVEVRLIESQLHVPPDQRPAAAPALLPRVQIVVCALSKLVGRRRADGSAEVIRKRSDLTSRIVCSPATRPRFDLPAELDPRRGELPLWRGHGEAGRRRGGLRASGTDLRAVESGGVQPDRNRLPIGAEHGHVERRLLAPLEMQLGGREAGRQALRVPVPVVLRLEVQLRGIGTSGGERDAPASASVPRAGSRSGSRPGRLRTSPLTPAGLLGALGSIPRCTMLNRNTLAGAGVLARPAGPGDP